MTIRGRNKTFLTLLTAMLLTAGVNSCSRHANDYSAFSTIGDDGWAYGSTFVYLPEIEDSIADGTLRIAVRHTNDFPYRNLWLEVTSQVMNPDSTLSFRADTVNMVLADAYGNWLGSGLGSTFQKADTISPRYRLISGAPVRVRHIMRLERVNGLEQVGIIFQEQ